MHEERIDGGDPHDAPPETVDLTTARQDPRWGSVKIIKDMLNVAAFGRRVVSSDDLAARIFIAIAQPDVTRTQAHYLEPLAHLNYLPSVLDIDRSFIPKRDQEYGGSWKKRGGTGAMHMLLRKADRLETGVMTFANYDVFEFLNAHPDRIDDVQDLRRYLALVESEWLRLRNEGRATRSG